VTVLSGHWILNRVNEHTKWKIKSFFGFDFLCSETHIFLNMSLKTGDCSICLKQMEQSFWINWDWECSPVPAAEEERSSWLGFGPTQRVEGIDRFSPLTRALSSLRRIGQFARRCSCGCRSTTGGSVTDSPVACTTLCHEGLPFVGPTESFHHHSTIRLLFLGKTIHVALEFHDYVINSQSGPSIPESVPYPLMR
jgi:hypothetical protein